MNTPISIHDRTWHRSGYAFILIFALMAMGIAAGGYLYYLDYEQKFRSSVESQLSGIAELKVGELALWRKERLGDGAVLFKNRTFSALVRRFLEKPGDVDAQRQLQDWMGKYLSAYHYTQACLIDAKGGMRISVPQIPGQYVSSVARNVTEILRSGRVGIEDFHRNTPGGPANLAVVIPIFDDLDDSRPLGVVSLHIDPAIYLYSFISRWPTPSETGETLLVRRDGDDVLFLSELRFRENAPLNLRIPLTKVTMPAVRAALGQTGIFEGVDYRGAPVISAIRAVPDSPWSLLARMNTSEVYAPVRERLGLMVVFIGTLLLGAGIAMSLTWRQMGARYREQGKAAEIIRAAEERYRSIFVQAADAIWLIDAQTGAILDFNTAAHESMGYTREEFAQLSITDLEATESPEEIALHIEKVRAKGSDVFETTHQTKHGELRYVLVNVKAVTFGGTTCFQSIQRDITERKEYEAELKRSNAELEQFSYAVSHDMRQPLRMISSYLQLIEMSMADQLDGEKRGYFDFAIEGARRIDQMLVALLEYSRVGRMGEPPAWAESRAMLDEALQFLQPAIAEAQARLNISGDWPRIFASRNDITRLLQNLIGNAIKYRIAGRIPEIAVTSGIVKNEWHLCVSDNGVGLIPDQIKRLFKVFQRLQARDAYEGTGIGLALCRKIAEHHKGRIWAESEGEGKGSKFCVVLPCGGKPC